MIQDNASFTFLHRIEEVELNIEDGRWQSVLALALTLPDICGGIAFPEIVKRYRDGRAVLDRNQRPTRDVGNQYIRWFDTYAAHGAFICFSLAGGGKKSIHKRKAVSNHPFQRTYPRITK